MLGVDDKVQCVPLYLRRGGSGCRRDPPGASATHDKYTTWHLRLRSPGAAYGVPDAPWCCEVRGQVKAASIPQCFSCSVKIKITNNRTFFESSPHTANKPSRKKTKNSVLSAVRSTPRRHRPPPTLCGQHSTRPHSSSLTVATHRRPPRPPAPRP